MISINYLPEEYKKGLYYGNMLGDIYVPERFSNRIVGHVVSNYLSRGEYFKPPLYLAIQGSPGEGKTTQALAACVQKGIIVKYISSSELSGEYESDSKQKLEEVYEQTLKIRESGFIVCALLDDFHLGNSNINSANGRTINAELLVSYMMNLVDSKQDNHIPIILTGNDYSGTYEALLRDGRADIYNWKPSIDEKIEIVKMLFAYILQTNELNKIDRFVREYSQYSVAFFAQLRNDLRRNYIERVIGNYSTINRDTISRINDLVLTDLRQTDIKTLKSYADERIRARKEGKL